MMVLDEVAMIHNSLFVHPGIHLQGSREGIRLSITSKKDAYQDVWTMNYPNCYNSDHNNNMLTFVECQVPTQTTQTSMSEEYHLSQ
jgi:hypothetical protein